jgi:hypothetical protein
MQVSQPVLMRTVIHSMRMDSVFDCLWNDEQRNSNRWENQSATRMPPAFDANARIG